MATYKGCWQRKIKDSTHLYHPIKGIDLYQKTKEILQEYTLMYYWEKFTGKPLWKSNSYSARLNDTGICANKVFESRTPAYEIPETDQSHLAQSLYSWEHKFDDYRFDISTMVMMDFNIPQNNYCQFKYVLPFTENSALLEETVTKCIFQADWK